MKPDIVVFSAEIVAEALGGVALPKLKRHARDHGCCLDIEGEVRFTQADVEALVRSYRVKRTTKGPLRMLTDDFRDDEDGFVVFIGSITDPETLVCVVWAPLDPKGLPDVLDMVQYGSAEKLAILSWGSATPAEVRQFEADMKADGDHFYGKWYRRGFRLVEKMTSLERSERAELYEDDEFEDDDVE